MNRNHLRPLLLAVALFLATMGVLIGGLIDDANGVIVEQADRHVKRVHLTYAEPVGTQRYPHRVYFETNDGAAYRYLNARVCVQANAVPDRICYDAFWYAR